MLLAGEYHLEAVADPGVDFEFYRGLANFDFEFTLVPEPTNGVLLLLGAAVLCAGGRRSRRQNLARCQVAKVG